MKSLVRNKGVKSLFIVIIAVLAIGSSISADAGQYLGCDPQPNIVASEVEVDGIVNAGTVILSADGLNLLLYDVSGLSSGAHTFKARLKDASGWWGGWNAVPFDASKPGEATLRIVDQ